ncbi:GNAT family N-acetyltransferase [Enterobacter asburiae]|uniref:GNAT family N-acetyltransferase n=1 Tax=Enterobacter asburiae TaxID=61645 RepID=UPI0029497E90|nr:GNAT family N-acetyltransferase [Enterobacter asburiae]MDV5192901.1 GNAT family N-acetyltransferase [Enterobacter asburiae]MDV5269102.1 GNAT family N-acetyltransferase [Enterobacter asburiae]
MNTSLQIKNLTRDDILTHLDALAAILENCVSGGASVSFMLPFSLDKARSFWRGIAESVGRNERLVLASIDPQDGVIGTVQLIVDQPENQPHRADVAKLLVHEKARRKGAAMALMEALEAEARARDISVLVLDTSTGSGAETFYQRAAWQKVGEIPRYALMPDGAMTATSVFYKFL